MPAPTDPAATPSTSHLAVCFVDMPFGKKKDPVTGIEIDFDAVYNKAIRPAIEDVGLAPKRGDQEQTGGVIHVPMFARILLSDFMVADLTLGNPNVFYELGIRHMAKPFTTVPIFATTSALPFDVASVRSIPYDLQAGVLSDEAATKLRAAIAQRLRSAKEAAAKDSPIYDLIAGLPDYVVPPEVDNALHERMNEQDDFAARIATAKGDKKTPNENRKAALLELQASLGDLSAARRSSLLALMFAFRDIEAFAEMVALCEDFPDHLRQNPIVQQQWALALNRRKLPGDADRAASMLREIIDRRGPDPESLGILGRVSKDHYVAEREETDAAGEPPSFVAMGHLKKAIQLYTEGFQTDPRNYYPGINAVTLLIHRGSEADRTQARALISLVHFALGRRGTGPATDYWDIATALELACCEEDWETAPDLTGQALAVVTKDRKPFNAKTTLNNFRFLREGLQRAGRDLTALDEIMAAYADTVTKLTA